MSVRNKRLAFIGLLVLGSVLALSSQESAQAAGSICGSFTWLKAKPIVNPQMPGQQQGTFAFDKNGFQESGTGAQYLLAKTDGIFTGKTYRIYDPVIVSSTPGEQQALVVPVGQKITNWSRLEQVSSCSASVQPPNQNQQQQQQQQQQNPPPPPPPPPVSKVSPLCDPGEPCVHLWTDHEYVPVNGCTTIHWASENVAGVYSRLDDFGNHLPRPFNGSQYVCLKEDDRSFVMDVQFLNGGWGIIFVTVQIRRQPVAPPPYVPPPAPVYPTAVPYVADADRIEGQVQLSCPKPQAEEKSFFDKLFSAYAAEKNPFDTGECTWFVFSKRPDAINWLAPSGNDAWKWASLAKNAGIKVDHNPQIGDIAVWDTSCGGPYSTAGHVGYVTGVGTVNGKSQVTVDESNWNNDHQTHLGSKYMVRDCMQFVHSPDKKAPEQTSPVPKPVPTPEPQPPSCFVIFGITIWCPQGSW